MARDYGIPAPKVTVKRGTKYPHYAVFIPENTIEICIETMEEQFRRYDPNTLCDNAGIPVTINGTLNHEMAHAINWHRNRNTLEPLMNSPMEDSKRQALVHGSMWLLIYKELMRRYQY